LKPSDLNPKDITRREMYQMLPFTSVFGMQKREAVFNRTLSNMNLSRLDLAQDALLKEDLDVDQVILTTPLLTAVVVAVTACFLTGYNTGVINAPEAVIFPGHTTLEWSLAVSVFAIGGPVGAIVGGWSANHHGRRGAVIIDAFIYLVGGIFMFIAQNIWWIVFGRAIIGLAAGFASVVIPIYLGELAPPTLRGALGTLTQFSLVIGILVSELAAIPLATEEGWRYLLGLTAFLAVAMLACSGGVLETPRWLLAHGGGMDTLHQPADPNTAKLVRVNLKLLRGFRSDDEVEKEVGHLMAACVTAQTQHESAHSGGAVWDLLTLKSHRLLVGGFVVLHMAQQLTGVNAVFYYSTSFFQGVVSDPVQGTILCGAVNVIAVYVALKLMDKCGRRTLVLWSAVGMLACAILLTLALMKVLSSIVALLAVMGFVSFFEIGLGPIPWLIVAEMFDTKYVATAMSVACQINWACNFIVGLVFPYMNQTLQEWCFVPFGVVLVLTIIYSYYLLPETAGKDTDQLVSEQIGIYRQQATGRSQVFGRMPSRQNSWIISRSRDQSETAGWTMTPLGLDLELVTPRISEANEGDVEASELTPPKIMMASNYSFTN